MNFIVVKKKNKFCVQLIDKSKVYNFWINTITFFSCITLNKTFCIRISAKQQQTLSEMELFRKKVASHQITWKKCSVTEEPALNTLSITQAKIYSSLLLSFRRNGKLMNFRPTLAPITEDPEEWTINNQFRKARMFLKTF